MLSGNIGILFGQGSTLKWLVGALKCVKHAPSQVCNRRIIANTFIGATILFSCQPYIGTHYIILFFPDYGRTFTLMHMYVYTVCFIVYFCTVHFIYDCFISAITATLYVHVHNIALQLTVTSGSLQLWLTMLLCMYNMFIVLDLYDKNVFLHNL